MADRVELDGSEGEGGGQILRSALTLSVMTGTPFEIRQIRANRKPGGLRPQHLQAVHAARDLCGATLRGAAVDSRALTFEPGELRPGDYAFDIGTAGNVGLVLHTVYLPLWSTGRPSTVTVVGGTHNPFAPCVDYLRLAWAPALRKLGLDAAVESPRAGFYPRGGGELVARLSGEWPPKPLTWSTRGNVRRVTPISMVARLPRSIAERQAARAAAAFSGELKDRLSDAVVEERPSHGPGTMLGLHLAFDDGETFVWSLGERGKPAERVADEAVAEAVAFLAADAPVDPHLADQLLLPLVFATGPSQFATTAVTRHLLTNASVVGRFIDRVISVDGAEGGPGRVTIGSG